jgi:hypothetical protein
MRNPRTSLYLLSGIILLVGFVGAAFIYRTAANAPNNVLGYVEGDGSVYPVMPEDSKTYLRDMELYGGKANVLADELRRWFAGLWHGKSLAYTIACVSALLALGVFSAAARLPDEER